MLLTKAGDGEEKYFENVFKRRRCCSTEELIQQPGAAVVDRRRSALEYRGMERSLAPKMIVQERLRDTGLLGDQAHARALETITGEHLFGGVADAFTRGVAVGAD